MKVLVPIGLLSEITKLAPIVHVLRRRGLEVRMVATGMHEDETLAALFYERFALEPDEVWSRSGDDAERLGRILECSMREIEAHRPDLVLMIGDSSGAPLIGLAARHHRVPVAVIDAGLRSFNEASVDEVNRRLVAQLSSLHFAPTEMASRLLQHEGIDRSRIRVVGDPMFDALRLAGVRRRPAANRSGILVDCCTGRSCEDPERLRELTDLVLRLAARFGSVTFPIDSATRTLLHESGAWSKLQDSAVRLFPRLPFDGMVELVGTSSVIVSDSADVQEQAGWLGVPVVVLDSSTPRWEGVAAGIAKLCGFDADRVIEAVEMFETPAEQERIAEVPCPYGDGQTAQRIAEVLLEPATRDILGLNAPNFVGRPVDVTKAGELLVG